MSHEHSDVVVRLFPDVGDGSESLTAKKARLTRLVHYVERRIRALKFDNRGEPRVTSELASLEAEVEEYRRARRVLDARVSPTRVVEPKLRLVR